MDNLDKTFTEEIVKSLQKKLRRDLTAKEHSVFTRRRSLLAYEMILDFVEDDSKSENDIKDYVIKVISE